MTSRRLTVLVGLFLLIVAAAASGALAQPTPTPLVFGVLNRARLDCIDCSTCVKVIQLGAREGFAVGGVHGSAQKKINAQIAGLVMRA